MAKADILGQIEKQVKRCRECRLWRGRKNAVPGEGSFSPEIAFIGEAPGSNEDEKGRPFCGRAGDLLNQLLSLTNFKRSDVWIGNVIKCRPPDNRGPMVDELRSCKPYLDEQVRLLNPKIIVTLGRFALEYFSKDLQISKDHGVPRRIGDWVIYPLYHPAAALRSPQVLDILRKEFMKIPKVLESVSEVKEEVRRKGDGNQIELFG